MLKEIIRAAVNLSHRQKFPLPKQAQSGQKIGWLLTLAAIVPGVVVGALGRPALADTMVVTPGYSYGWPSQRIHTQIMTVGPRREHQLSITQPSINQWGSTQTFDRRWDNNRNDNWRDRRWDNHRDQDDWRDRRWDNRNSNQSWGERHDQYRDRDNWRDQDRDRHWDRDGHGDRRSVIIVPNTGYSSYSRSVYQIPTCTTTVLGGVNSSGQGGVRFYSSSCN